MEGKMGESADQTPTWLGVPLKHISLVTLTCQNSALILIMHYSRIMPLVGGQRYLTSTAVLLNEIMKFAICLTVSLFESSKSLPPSTPATTLFKSLYGSVFAPDCWKLAIPALLYTLQNTLQYVAVSNLDAATFQVTYQLKILTTALFSVTMLRRTLSTRKWASLLLLTLGIAIVQFPAYGGASDNHHSKRALQLQRSTGELLRFSRAWSLPLVKRSATYEGIQEDQHALHPQMNSTVGLAAVIVACMLSGLAGVYFEKVLKNSSATLWVRNVQLSFFSLFPALFIGVVLKDGREISQRGFFSGYNVVVWTAIVFQALGGIIVAMVVNYADNIAKNFATSISILISFLASVWFFDFKVTTHFLIGASVVMFSTYLYSSSERTRASSVKIARLEQTTIGGASSKSEYDGSAVKLMPPHDLQRDLSTARPSSPLNRIHKSPWKDDKSG